MSARLNWYLDTPASASCQPLTSGGRLTGLAAVAMTAVPDPDGGGRGQPCTQCGFSDAIERARDGVIHLR
jgi:hypothetical protein